MTPVTHFASQPYIEKAVNEIYKSFTFGFWTCIYLSPNWTGSHPFLVVHLSPVPLLIQRCTFFTLYPILVGTLLFCLLVCFCSLSLSASYIRLSCLLLSLDMSMSGVCFFAIVWRLGHVGCSTVFRFCFLGCGKGAELQATS